MLKFITILYHNDSEIQRLFDSIKEYFTEFELIISCNSSTENKIFDERIKYIGDKSNVGFGNAINRALNLISGDDVICVINSDVQFKRIDFDYVKMLVQDQFVVGPVCISKDQERQDTCRKNISLLGIIQRVLSRLQQKNNGSLAYEYSYQRDIEVDWIIGAVIFIQGNHFKALGGFDKHYFMYLEDADFCVRAKKYGLKVFYTEKIICEYEADRKSLTFNTIKNAKLLFSHITSFFIYALKHPRIFFKVNL